MRSDDAAHDYPRTRSGIRRLLSQFPEGSQLRPPPPVILLCTTPEELECVTCFRCGTQKTLHLKSIQAETQLFPPGIRKISA